MRFHAPQIPTCLSVSIRGDTIREGDPTRYEIRLRDARCHAPQIPTYLSVSMPGDSALGIIGLMSALPWAMCALVGVVGGNVAEVLQQKQWRAWRPNPPKASNPKPPNPQTPEPSILHALYLTVSFSYLLLAYF